MAKNRNGSKGATSGGPSPMTFKEVVNKITPRAPITEIGDRTLELSSLVASQGFPQIEIGTTWLEQASAVAPAAQGATAYEVKTSVRGVKLGVHVFRPSVPAHQVETRTGLLNAQDYPDLLQGFLPDHLALRPVPQPLSEELRVPRRIEATRSGDRRKRATTVFSPDDRTIYNDTAYPWSTIGRVDTAGGIASGVMVGPRHLLTVSHTIDWRADGSTGWVKFTPCYFDGSEPFGVAWAERVYFYYKVTPPTVDGVEEQYDYVVVVLSSRIGETVGWMGSRSYTDSWDGGAYWSHAGYPADLASAARPCFQGGIALNGSDSEPDEHEIMLHQGDVFPGQSGGPMFAWWTGETEPRVVSVQSWENSVNNGASGGSLLADLIVKARNEFP
jgi:V8-like Glu-specific endopeptidase